MGNMRTLLRFWPVWFLYICQPASLQVSHKSDDYRGTGYVCVGRLLRPYTAPGMEDKTIRPFVHELLKAYRTFIIRESYDNALEIMQSYTDLKQYSQAEFWQQKSEILKRNEEKVFGAMLRLYSGGVNDVIFHNESASKMLRLFVGREDLFAQETLDQNKRRTVSNELRPLTESVIKEHLVGKITADTFIQRPNSTVHFIVIDVDVSKQVLLQVQKDSDEYIAYMQKALDMASTVKNILKQMGITGYIEYSGNRGYHVWIFMTEWIPTRYANMLCEILEKKLGQPDASLTVEYFPNRTRIKPGKYGQALKIPYGIHGKTGERSYFLDEQGTPMMKIDTLMDGIAKASLSEIKRIIATDSTENVVTERKEVDKDISPFGELEPTVSEVLLKCNLLRYLCLKSVKTGYLNHFERLTVLYVFGHLGNVGKEFVHTVMRFTLNYKHDVTESFIRKMPEKPVSCVKLRDQYKQLTAEFGCSCNFKRTRNCYPSPVLHAISLASDTTSEITLPASRTFTKEKENIIKAELNVHSKAMDIATKLVETKKQKRGLDKTIRKLEQELGAILDAQGIDCMEIEMGMLSRRKNGDDVDWFIEI